MAKLLRGFLWVAGVCAVLALAARLLFLKAWTIPEDPALNAWKGNPANVPAAQTALLEHARENSAALHSAPAWAP